MADLLVPGRSDDKRRKAACASAVSFSTAASPGIICHETRGLRWNVLNSEIKWMSGSITAEEQRKVAAALLVRIGESVVSA
jgi:hypothetical protein